MRRLTTLLCQRSKPRQHAVDLIPDLQFDFAQATEIGGRQAYRVDRDNIERRAGMPRFTPRALRTGFAARAWRPRLSLRTGRTSATLRAWHALWAHRPHWAHNSHIALWTGLSALTTRAWQTFGPHQACFTLWPRRPGRAGRTRFALRTLRTRRSWQAIAACSTLRSNIATLATRSRFAPRTDGAGHPLRPGLAAFAAHDAKHQRSAI